MAKQGILERLKHGPVLGDGGYLLELEKRGWVRPGPFTPEVAIIYPDALRELHPSEPMFTFWDYKRNRWPRDAGLRLDHLLLSPVLAPRLTKAGVHRKMRGEEGASDHAPAWIILR